MASELCTSLRPYGRRYSPHPWSTASGGMDLPLGYSDGKVGSAAGLADAGDTPAILSVPRRPLYVVDHERFNRSFRRF
jgi:hypothetical protein